jgi:NAD(P) transhydrogenase beta subunit
VERREIMTETLIQLAYRLAAFFFIMALRALGRPETARRGMQLAAFGMAVAVLATLLHARIVSYEWLAVGAMIGAVVGYPLGMWVPMTAMPQRIALSHAFGALAATLVGVGEYTHNAATGLLARGHVLALGLEVLFGGLTVGSLMAFGKLQEILPGRPLTFRGQNAMNLVLLTAAVIGLGWLIVSPNEVWVFAAMLTIAVLVGILFVLPIGGGHAGGRVVAEFLCWPCCRRHGICDRQQHSDHRWRARRPQRLHPLDCDEQGHESLLRQCALWRLRLCRSRRCRDRLRRRRNDRYKCRGRRAAIGICQSRHWDEASHPAFRTSAKTLCRPTKLSKANRKLVRFRYL